MTRWLPLLAVLVALGPAAASAEDADWSYDDVNNKAIAIQNDSRLAVLCGENNRVIVYYSVPQAALDKALANRKTPYLSITTDGDLSGLSGYAVKAFPQDIEEARYFTFGDKAATNIAKQIGKGKGPVLVTVSTKNPATAGKNYPRYNSNVYPADGADEAIATLFEHCPQD